jgi:hypothetical protein
MVSSGFGGEDVSEVQARLTRVMLADGLMSFKFVRAPSDYYSQVSTKQPAVPGKKKHLGFSTNEIIHSRQKKYNTPVDRY